MKINLICFSQTGNTRKVAKEMTAVFRNAGHSAQTSSFKKASLDDFTGADLLGIGAPCFESQAPTPVREFLRNLPPLNGKKAFVFATSGGAPGRVLWDLAHPLQSKGADVLAGFLCRGTCYYPIPCLVGRFPDRPDETDFEKARKFAADMLHHIESNASIPMEGSRSDPFRHGLGFYNIMGAVLKDPLVRFLMPVPKAEERCNQCGWCVKECPTGSIQLNPLPTIAGTCIRCYRCLTGCPEKALAVNWGISNFLTWTLYNTTFERWLGDVQPGEKCY